MFPCGVSTYVKDWGSWAKIGTGTQILSGANTYTGNTIISGGVLQLGNGGTTGSLDPSSQITNNATLAFNRSNTLTQGTDFDSAFGGTGGVNQIGSGITILSGNNTYAGTTIIDEGTLVQNGAYSGGGDFTVYNGGTLKGSGTANGDLTVMSGGTVAPGNSIESLGGFTSFTFNNDSIFDYEIDTTAALAVAADLLYGSDLATLTIDSGALLNLTDLGTNSLLPIGTKFTLIAYNAGTWNNGIFDTYADDSTFSFAGNMWTINYNDTTPGSNFPGDATSQPTTEFVTITTMAAVVIPEPSTYALALLGLAGLGVVGWRKRKLERGTRK